LVSFSNALTDLSNPRYGAVQRSHQRDDCLDQPDRDRNGLIDAFVRLGTALVRVSITTIEVGSTRAEQATEIVRPGSAPDELCSPLVEV
jgi:hypothetical protein